MSAPGPAPALIANARSLTLPLTLSCLLLLAAGVLGTAFPHQRRGKSLMAGAGVVGQKGAAVLLALTPLPWLHPAG